MNDISLQYELSYLREGANELQKYLMSEELFWPLSATPPEGKQAYPRLTLGNLELNLARLRARVNKSKQHPGLWKIDHEIEATREEWRSAWIRKSSWEFRSRIKQWENYINELRRDLDEHSPYYSYEVRLRVILNLLRGYELEIDNAYLKLLAGLDTVLRAIFVPNGFVWEDSLSSGFPRDPYWYLWGHIKEA